MRPIKVFYLVAFCLISEMSTEMWREVENKVQDLKTSGFFHMQIRTQEVDHFERQCALIYLIQKFSAKVEIEMGC